ncbi:MAG: hypothetical protein NTAFB05_32000 [Nitrobacter sp.]
MVNGLEMWRDGEPAAVFPPGARPQPLQNSRRSGIAPSSDKEQDQDFGTIEARANGSAEPVSAGAKAPDPRSNNIRRSK